MKLFVCMECGWWVVADEWFSTCDECIEWRMVEADDAAQKIANARGLARASGYGELLGAPESRPGASNATEPNNNNGGTGT